LRDTKSKGDFGEISVIKDLIGRGYSVAIPFGENNPFDLVAYKDGLFQRVQVKYRESKNGIIKVGLRTISNGKPKFPYTRVTIDLLAVYDITTDTVLYVPSERIEGRTQINLRIGG